MSLSKSKIEQSPYPDNESARYRGSGTAKQVFRFRHYDEIGCAWECREAAERLLRPVVIRGELAEPLPNAAAARAHAAASLAALPAECRRLAAPEPRRVEYSPALQALAEESRRQVGAGIP